MSNGSTPKCPQCGAPLQENALAGLCPNCLMALNLKTETSFTGETEPAHPPLPPEEIAPHFPQLEILELLGRGGMGVVYKARQRTLNRLVALKLLAPERVGDPKFAERFAREAQALAALSHPNIVTIHDFGRAGGFYYLLMEFVDGVNLRQLLRARKFTPEEALAIVPPLCDALQFAHERGIVHRDIKPENLLLDKSGRVKIADFGIAKMLGVGNDAQALDAAASGQATQNALGTPGYSAPEQLAAPQRVDSRSDIFSLGVVFYEMLTGELPGKTIELPSKKVQIDVRLDEVVLRALEKNPEQRYQHASVLKTQIETIVATPAPSRKAGEQPPPALKPEPPKISSLTPANPSSPRLSRTAIIGLIGLFLSIMTAGGGAVVMIFYRLPPVRHSLTWILFLAGVSFLVAVMFGPVATTLLGWIAVGQIRRSVGKLYGMGLALFEGLLFPVLIGNGVFLGFVIRISRNGPWLLLALGTMLLLDFLIVRGLWRKFQTPRIDASADKAGPKPSRLGFAWTMAGVFVLLLFLLIGFMNFTRHGGSSTRNDMLPTALAPTRTSESRTLDGVTKSSLSMDGNDQTDLFDPETGSISSVSKPSNHPQVLALLSQAGLVITRDKAENKTVLMGFGGYLPQTARSNQWDGLTDIQALQMLQKNSSSAGVIMAATANFPLPQTFFFKTTSQKIGVLQVTGFSENPRGVQVRYKFFDDKLIKQDIDDQSVEPAPQASKELWSPTVEPGEKPDPDKIRLSIKPLMDAGDYEAALQRQLWYFNHASQYGVYDAIRLSFGISDWQELARRYPKAQQALIEIRDRDARSLLTRHGYIILMMELRDLNDALSDDGATVELFKKLMEKDQKFAHQCYFFMEDLLVSQGEYQWCYDHMGSAEERLAAIRLSLESTPLYMQRKSEMRDKRNQRHGVISNGVTVTDFAESMDKRSEDQFIGATRRLIEILVATGHKTDAEKIRDEAVTVLDDARLKTSVEDAEKTIRHRTISTGSK